MHPRPPLLRPVAAAVALLLLAAPAPARQQQGEGAPLPAFEERLEVRVVNVEVFVTDRRGDPVSGLGKDDFQLFVDGREVEITNFYGEVLGRPRAGAAAGGGRPQTAPFRPAEVPGQGAPDRRLYLTLFVDHTRLDPSNRQRAFAAIDELVTRRLDPDDLVSVVSYDGSLVFHADFLFDREAISRILDEIADTAATPTHQRLERRQIIAELTRGQSGGFLGRSSTEFLATEPLLARIRAYAAEEYHRALTSIRQLDQLAAAVAGLPGRKAILYVSDGIPNRPGEELFAEYINRVGGGNPDAEPGLRRFDFNTDYTREVGNYDLLRDVERLGERANRAGVTLYALDAESDHGAELRSALTEQGAISSTLTIAAENLREPLEVAAATTGGRRIQASGLLTEHLTGLASDFHTFYSLGFTPGDWEPGSSHRIDVRVRGKGLAVRHRETVQLSGADERAAQATVSTLLFQGLDNPLGISLHPQERRAREDGSAVLPVLVDIPVSGISLVPGESTHAGRLTFFVSVRDAAGNPGAVQKIPFHLEIPADKMADALGRSAHYPLPVVLRPGDQQLAVGVRDDVSGVLATARIDVARFSPADKP